MVLLVFDRILFGVVGFGCYCRGLFLVVLLVLGCGCWCLVVFAAFKHIVFLNICV